jgi:predicted metalloprotease
MYGRAHTPAVGAALNELAPAAESQADCFPGDDVVSGSSAAIVNNILSGWDLTEEDIRDVCLAAAGRISTDEMLERGLARYRRDHGQDPDATV